MNDESRNQLLCIATAIFAVRIFRSPLTEARPDGDRNLEATRAALDAAAIMAAVGKITDAADPQ